jgi:hypothetical protein
VYEVIMSRVKALRMSPCAVVKAPKQFSWYGEPGKPILPFSKPLQDLLKRAKNHPKVLESIEFRWFFSGDVWPKWAGKMDCRVIGGHKFCKEVEKNNGSDGEVRHPGEGAEEESERSERGSLRDVRNRVPAIDFGGTKHAQDAVQEQRQQPSDSVSQDAGATDCTTCAVRGSQSGDAGQG